MLLTEGPRIPDRADDFVVTYVVDEAEAAHIRAAFAEGKQEDAFWQEHYQEFVGRYPDQFVAVARTDWTVVAASPGLEGVIRLAEEQGFPVGSIWVKFIFATPLHVNF